MFPKKLVSVLFLVVVVAAGFGNVFAAGKTEKKPSLNADGKRLEKKYADTLAAFRSELVKSLPNLNAQKLADFQKAYAAEGVAQSAYEKSLKGKANIGATDVKTKEDEAKAGKAVAEAYAQAQANTLAAAKPILAELEKLLSSETLDARLVKCAVLANATPTGLANFAQQGREAEALVAKLFADDVLMKQMLISGGAKGGNYGKAMQIYSEIQRASKRAGEGVLQHLALGTSLEQAAPGRAEFDPVKRYLSYEKAYLNGELDPAFKSMNAWECRMITDAPESDEDLAWCREMMRNYRPDHIYEPDYRWRYVLIVRTDVPYKNPDPAINDGTSRIQQLLAGGGKCGPRAFVGRFAARAFGIPTWGVTQPGHAALAHWTPEGWTINLGADWKFSWWDDPTTGNRPGPDFHLETKARAYPQDFLKVLRAEWIGDALGEPKVNPKQPGSGGSWQALALSQKKAIVAEAKPITVALAGEDLAEATESKKAEAIASAKITAEDKKITVSSNGVITIPAASCTSPKGNTRNITFMKSFTGGMQMSYSKDQELSYAVQVPSAGKYELTARVVTIHKDQKLNLKVGADKASVSISLPYTLGKWQETPPVKVTLAGGMNTLRFAGEKDGWSMTIKEFALKPVR